MTMESTLMAAINTTNYLNGLFGLGIAKGTFGEEVMDSPLIQAVQTFGWIPSYSYGYTAGAHYRMLSSTAMQLAGVLLTYIRKLPSIISTWRLRFNEVG